MVAGIWDALDELDPPPIHNPFSCHKLANGSERQFRAGIGSDWGCKAR
uniref:Uncharacterized protein n=1 Tax=Arundo donax TaxID=35708 RepID=A0A0A9EVY6_ARUDO